VLPYAQDKQGRYVRIQLLGKNHLSLAEVQVIGGELCSPKIKSTKEQALIYKTQRRALKIEGHLYLYVVIYRGCRFKFSDYFSCIKFQLYA
jgi:hypothetical protein